MTDIPSLRKRQIELGQLPSSTMPIPLQQKSPDKLKDDINANRNFITEGLIKNGFSYDFIRDLYNKGINFKNELVNIASQIKENIIRIEILVKESFIKILNSTKEIIIKIKETIYNELLNLLEITKYQIKKIIDLAEKTTMDSKNLLTNTGKELNNILITIEQQMKDSNIFMLLYPIIIGYLSYFVIQLILFM